MEQRLFFKFGLLPPMPCLTWYQEYRNLLTTENKRLRRESFDILWVEDVYSWPFALDIARKLETKPKIRICNSYNIESNVAARTAALVNDSSTKEAIQRDGQQLASMEREAYSRSQLTIVCSEEDRISGLRLCPSANFAVIGNGVDTAYFSSTEQPEKSYGKPLILFTGTFSYGPNHQAANYFSSEVLPLIRRQIPEVTFMIAGSQAASTYDHLKKLGIEVACVSDPADIRPCFVNASLFIVPLQTGGGTRLKILEAMAMGVPVVSTTIGAEGLGAQDHKHLMIADNAETFANRCIEVLKNSECQQQLSQNALTWVRENYDWNLLCNQAKNSVESLLGA